MSGRGDKGEVSPTASALAYAAYAVHAAAVLSAARRPSRCFPVVGKAARVAGISLVAVGTAMYALGAGRFRSFEQLSGVESGRLVICGIYRYSRNPQNVGWGLILTGAALSGRSAAALTRVAPFWVLLHLHLVFLEEPHLEKTFGEEYRKYRRAAPRYLGAPKR